MVLRDAFLPPSTISLRATAVRALGMVFRLGGCEAKLCMLLVALSVPVTFSYLLRLLPTTCRWLLAFQDARDMSGAVLGLGKGGGQARERTVASLYALLRGHSRTPFSLVGGGNDTGRRRRICRAGAAAPPAARSGPLHSPKSSEQRAPPDTRAALFVRYLCRTLVVRNVGVDNSVHGLIMSSRCLTPAFFFCCWLALLPSSHRCGRAWTGPAAERT